MPVDQPTTTDRPATQSITINLVREGDTIGQHIDATLRTLAPLINGARVQFSMTIIRDDLLIKTQFEDSGPVSANDTQPDIDLPSPLTDAVRAWLGPDSFEAWRSNRPHDISVKDFVSTDAEECVSVQMAAALTRIESILRRNGIENVSDLIHNRTKVKRFNGIGQVYLSIIESRMIQLGYEFSL